MHVKRNICNAVKKKHRVPEFRKTMNTNNKKKFRIYLNGKMQQYNTGQADQIYLISFFFFERILHGTFEMIHWNMQ